LNHNFCLTVGPRSSTSSLKWPRTYLIYDITHKKPETQNFFLIPDSKTCWVFWGFEHLFSAIGWGAMWLESTKVSLVSPRFPSTIYS